MLKRTIAGAIIFSVTLALPDIAWAQQPMWTLDPFGKEKKPTEFENRTLGSEKTAEKKFTVPRHFIQNTVTHYNYYFNANNKVNMVVERAKFSNKDDYTKLLSFYPYSLKNTASQKKDLDSVIYTCTAGILIHDLRNDWIDNLYLLIGKTYFYRKEFDSAAMTFQFINYNLFPRNKNEEDSRVVGTNSSASGSSISIANPEKRNILQKFASLPPSRNDALLWLARTQIEQEEFGESAGLINTLQNDPNLPKRLRGTLEEINAYWFFKQNIYDSAAVHLVKALNNAETQQDRARWEYLLAQIYEMNHQYEKATKYYSEAGIHTVDPLMDIYSRLNEAIMLKGSGNPKELDNSIDKLNRMAHRDKFDGFRDIIYYAAGQLSLEKPDTSLAIKFFRKSLKYNDKNISFKNKAFLQLADIAFNQKKYPLASSLYDSLQLSDTTLANRLSQIKDRKNALTKIVEDISKINREDSLQRIAALSPAEKDDLIKKLLKKLRKENGLKEDNNDADGNNSNPFNSNQQPTDLFASSNTKGEWYFYNNALKSAGFNDFKTKWGTRTNTDNWRRKSASNVPNSSIPGDINDKANANTKKDSSNIKSQNAEVSFESLMKDVPLTSEKLNRSNDTLASALLDLAKVYQNELDEYELAALTYEEYLKRFPDRLMDGEVYFGLYFCYTKMGNIPIADYYKKLLNTKFANSKSAKSLNNPASLNPKTKNPEATKLYDDIYISFIEGNFDKAITEKKKADSLYGTYYWTPQLLYIEALYNVKQRNDSIAIAGLQKLIASNPASPLKDKAVTMIDVLKRRKEIETYLTNLKITRDTGNNIVIVPDKPVVNNKPINNLPPVKDSTKKIIPPLVNGAFTMALSSPHFVLMVLEKVDPVYINEAKNAFTRYNQENYYGQPISINKDTLDADHNLLVISSFADATVAMEYYKKIKKAAPEEVSWLPANKYSFLIIANDNLQLLKSNKKLADYKKLLNTQFPNGF